MKISPALMALMAVLSVSQASFGQNVLKAVLIVGPQEDNTNEAIKKVRKISHLLWKNGIDVHEFYGELADWDKICRAADDASFFLYCGHGMTNGGDGKSGGLCVTTFVSASEIIEDLKLRKGAIVLFKSVCRGAGSSADDNGDIGITEAKTRVTNYSKPFFDIGAGCYFANNYDGGCLGFLENFFAGKNLEECFISARSFWADEEISEPYQHNSIHNIAIASRPGEGYSMRTTTVNGKKKKEHIKNSKGYPIAYVGNPKYTYRVMKMWDY